MADSYPDVPARRMGWDADGTVAVKISNVGRIFNELNATERAELNDEAPDGPTLNVGQSFAAIFPELREVDGFFAYSNATSQIDEVETSEDTTNGVDGTWTTRIADFPDSDAYAADHYRTKIQSTAVSNARGLRFSGFNSNRFVYHVHIYGEISPGETPDRLLFIDETTGVEYTASIDYGDTPRGSSEDLELRIKNNSATLTATTIQYTAEALDGDAGNWFTYTLPGGATFQATRQIASLAPATTTGIITVRRITPAAEMLGLAAPRTYLNVGTWS